MIVFGQSRFTINAFCPQHQARVTQLEAELLEKQRALARAQQEVALVAAGASLSANGKGNLGSGSDNTGQAQAMLVEELQETLRGEAGQRQRLERELSEERASVLALRRELASASRAPTTGPSDHNSETQSPRGKRQVDMLTSRLLCLYNRIRKLIAKNCDPPLEEGDIRDADTAQLLVPGAKVFVLEEASGRHNSRTADQKTKYSGCSGTVLEPPDSDGLVQVELHDVDLNDESRPHLSRSALWLEHGREIAAGTSGSSADRSSAVSDVAALHQQVAALEAELEQLDSEKIDEIEARDETIEELQMRVKELEAISTNKSAKLVLAAAQEQIDTLTARVEELERLLAEAQSEAHEARTHLQQQQANSRNDDAGRDEDVDALEAAFDAAEDRAKRLEVEKSQMLEALQAAEARCNELESQLSQAQLGRPSNSISALSEDDVPLTFEAIEVGSTVQVRTDFEQVGRAQALADMAWDEDSRAVCGRVGRVVDKDGVDGSVQVEFSPTESIWFHHQALTGPASSSSNNPASDASGAENDSGKLTAQLQRQLTEAEDDLAEVEAELAGVKKEKEQLSSKLQDAEAKCKAVQDELEELQRSAGQQANASQGSNRAAPLVFADLCVGDDVQLIADVAAFEAAHTAADLECALQDQCGNVGRVVDKDADDFSVQVEFDDKSGGWLPVDALCLPQLGRESVGQVVDTEKVRPDPFSRRFASCCRSAVTCRPTVRSRGLHHSATHWCGCNRVGSAARSRETAAGVQNGGS